MTPFIFLVYSLHLTCTENAVYLSVSMIHIYTSLLHHPTFIHIYIHHPYLSHHPYLYPIIPSYPITTQHITHTTFHPDADTPRQTPSFYLLQSAMVWGYSYLQSTCAYCCSLHCWILTQ